MRIRLPRIALAVALAVLSVVALGSAAQAQAPDVATFLTIQPNDAIRPGETISISVRLTTGRGDPVTSKSVMISLTSDLTRAVQTDADGNATYTTRVDLTPGAYTIIVSFGGALGLQPSRATEDVVVVGAANETVLTVQPMGPVGIDTNAQLQARLTTAHGAPIEGARLQIIVDGVAGSQGTTDKNGYAFINIGKGNALGTHQVSVVYKGSNEYAPTSQQLNLDIRPLDIELHTSPVLEGVRVMVQNKVYTTDKDGIVRIPVDTPGTYHVEILPYESSNPDVQADFDGWADGTSTPFHDVNVPGSGPIEAGFNLSYQVRQVFIDLQGRPVDPRRISSMTFKRSDGVIYDFNNGDPRWLAANYLVRRLDGLDESPFLYSLLSVIVNGTNVVSEQQQRFTAEPKDTWTIQLLLFSANLKSHDMMFGFPLGSSARLVYPDGMKENIPLNAKGEGQVFSLPRGAYKVGVNTNLGIAPVSSLTMSRDQEVDLKVVSYLDILAVLLVGLVLGPGLLFIGQPKLREFVLSGALLEYARRAVRKIMNRRSEVETE
jgi:hypothetical protein